VTFLSALALAVGLLVIAPYLAHRLRRRRAEEQPFAPAHLVSPAPPKARRRSRLEDRALFVTRSATVVALAVLGATPFVSCSRLSLSRSGGASVAVAIVIDDSMSMRASVSSAHPGPSRFDRARRGALELLASAREGDAIAVVLAGAPARVALAATTDLGAARAAIEAVVQSDRSTDLNSAVALSRGLVASLPQVDRRVVVLSDMADGHPDAAPLGEAGPVPVWVALPELRGARPDCALVRADRSGARVRVGLACGPGATASGRDVVVEDAEGKELGRAACPAPPETELTVALPSDDAKPARARLTAGDAIARDDEAPVIAAAARGAIAVVADPADEAVATGGAPIAEQALAALKVDVDIHPIPAFPDRVDDLRGELGVLLDDPAGLTPEQRHALGAFLDGGGLVLLALGPHAASAPLGASLEPVLGGPVAWSETGSRGADPAGALGPLAEPAQSLTDLDAARRAVLASEDVGAFEALVRWSDGAPLIARRAMGRGEAWLVTLPFTVDASDLSLRPAFLALLDAWVSAARDRAAPTRTEVGTPWTFPGARSVEVVGPAGAVAGSREGGVVRVVPPLLGAYRVNVDGRSEVRVAAPGTRELDLRPRAVGAMATGEASGEQRTRVDVSGHVALVVLALVAAELALRLRSSRKLATT
jgi:hypothetical protein